MKLLIASFSALVIFFSMSFSFHKGDQQISEVRLKPVFSFGVIADVQYCDQDPVGNRFYRSSIVKLREAVKTFQADSVSFIINLGDLIDKDIKSFQPVMDIIDSTGLITYHVTGNHDYSVDSRYKNRLPVVSSLKKEYYSIVHGKFRFIFLDGNELSTYVSNNRKSVKYANEYIEGLKKKGEINAIEWNGGLSGEQLIWLKAQLQESVSSNEKVFLICHFPLFPENIHNLLNYKEVISVLENYHNIVAWISGHNHSGNYGRFNMIHFITLKGMVETETENSFAVIEVFKDKIAIKGYGREKSRELEYL